MKLKNLLACTAILLSSAAVTAATVTDASARFDVNIDVGTPPPAPVAEAVPAPRAGYEWVPGYWSWEGHRHQWHAGRWIEARPGYHYVGEHWEERGPKWHMVPGHWEHVETHRWLPGR